MYPFYALETYRKGRWQYLRDYPPRDRPHYYDELRKAFEGLVRVGKTVDSRPVGYRIVKLSVSGNVTVDKWTNGMVEEV